VLIGALASGLGAGLGLGARLLRPVFAKPRAWRIFDIGIAAVMAAVALAVATAPLTR
jgi:L-lysine exporter family protein LysE/ArgO